MFEKFVLFISNVKFSIDEISIKFFDKIFINFNIKIKKEKNFIF